MVLYPRIGLNWDRLPKVRLPRVKLPKGKSLSILPQFRTLLGKITQGKITQDKITQGGITQDFPPLGYPGYPGPDYQEGNTHRRIIQ